MDLLQLRYFLESAKTENLSKTAEKYIVPASSVSASIKRLENELGVRLFERTANKIRLSEKGKILAEALESAFGQVENAISDIKTSEENKEIRMLIKAKRTWITELVIEYKSKNPSVSFKMSHDFDNMDFSEFDIVIDEAGKVGTEMDRFILSVEKLCIKAGKDHPLVGEKLKMQDLKDAPFIILGQKNNMRRVLEEKAALSGFTPNIAIECADKQCLVKCVEAGMGLIIGSESALDESSERNLAALSVSDFKEVQSIYVYHRNPSAKDAVLSDFLNFLSSHARAD